VAVDLAQEDQILALVVEATAVTAAQAAQAARQATAAMVVLRVSR
jgi:hypothetical protein